MTHAVVNMIKCHYERDPSEKKVKINIWNIPENSRYNVSEKMVREPRKKKHFNLQYSPFLLKRKKQLYCVLVAQLKKITAYYLLFDSSSNNNRRFFPEYSPKQNHPRTIRMNRFSDEWFCRRISCFSWLYLHNRYAIFSYICIFHCVQKWNPKIVCAFLTMTSTWSHVVRWQQWTNIVFDSITKFLSMKIVRYV